jgi:hypothetical protein
LYAREYMLSPIDESSSLFPMGKITECFEDRTLVKEYAGPGEVYIGVDPAASGEIGADYSAFVIIALDPATGKRTILDIVRRKGMTLSEHVDILLELERRFKPVHVKVEKNAFQRWLEQEAGKVLSDVPLTGHVTGREKSDMRDGVPSLALLMERRMLSIPRGRSEEEEKADVETWEAEAVEVTDPLIEELHGMTWNAGKVVSVSKHDDTVMALWLCNMAIEEGSKMRGLAMAMVDTDEGRRPTRASEAARRWGRR